MSITLSFEALRKANVARLPQFKNARGGPAHPEADGSDWNIEQWLQAVIGEIGEYANVRKKFDRGDIDRDTFDAMAASELADVQVYLDLVAFRLGVDLERALRRGGVGSTFVTFKNVRAVTSARTFKRYPETLLCALTCAIGNLWESYCTVGPSLTKVVQVQLALDRLAHSLGIDLGAATYEKFNEVSIRVGSTVFLRADGGV